MRLSALLQLTSPALPVGAYSYSQGMESAIDVGLVRDAATAHTWIEDALRHVMARYEAPVWLRLHRAFAAARIGEAAAWNEDLLATRETRELRAESEQMGYSLVQLLGSLDQSFPLREGPVAYTTAHAWACTVWEIPEDPGLASYLYAWAENQVMAALKTVPLGQTAGQRLLFALRPALADCVATAELVDDDDLSTQTPMLALLSSAHEIQYSRLFRS